MRLAANNALVSREFQRRFRSLRSAIGIPLAMLLPAMVAWLTYQAFVRDNDPNRLDLDFNTTGFEAHVQPASEVGPPLFYGLVGTLALVLVFVVPSIAGSAIASERASDTLKPLQISTLTPGEIVAGKYVSSLGYLLLLLCCALPTLAVPYMLGGVSALAVGTAAGVLALFAIELAAVCLAISSIFRRVAVATAASFLTTGILLLGPWVAAALTAYFSQVSNPAADVPENAIQILGAFSPVSLGSWFEPVIAEQAGGDFDDSGGPAGWLRYLSTFISIGITVVSLRIAARRVRTPRP